MCFLQYITSENVTESHYILSSGVSDPKIQFNHECLVFISKMIILYTSPTHIIRIDTL